jgi:predicted phosphoribosyltransferase
LTIDALVGTCRARAQRAKRTEPAPDPDRDDSDSRGNAPALDVRGKTAILVDDGIATAGMLRAALLGARKRGAVRLIVAAPVAAAEAVADLTREADEVVCLATPRHLDAVGAWYQVFRPLAEQDVLAILAAARDRIAGGGKLRAGA